MSTLAFFNFRTHRLCVLPENIKPSECRGDHTLYNITSNHQWSHRDGTSCSQWMLIGFYGNPLRFTNQPWGTSNITPHRDEVCVIVCLFMCMLCWPIHPVTGCRVQMKWSPRGFAWIDGLNNLLQKHTRSFTSKLACAMRRPPIPTNTDLSLRRRADAAMAVWIGGGVPPPGTMNVSSHHITVWPSAPAEDGWRSTDGKRERACVWGLKLATIPPSRFCKDMKYKETHTHTHKFLSLILPLIWSHAFCVSQSWLLFKSTVQDTRGRRIITVKADTATVKKQQ